MRNPKFEVKNSVEWYLFIISDWEKQFETWAPEPDRSCGSGNEQERKPGELAPMPARSMDAPPLSSNLWFRNGVPFLLQANQLFYGEPRGFCGLLEQVLLESKVQVLLLRLQEKFGDHTRSPGKQICAEFAAPLSTVDVGVRQFPALERPIFFFEAVGKLIIQSVDLPETSSVLFQRLTVV